MVSSLKYSIIPESNPSGAYADIITPETIEREYRIVLSSLNDNSKLNQSVAPINPFSMFISFINAEKYRNALKIGKCFDLDLCRVFSAIAEKCVRLYKS